MSVRRGTAAVLAVAVLAVVGAPTGSAQSANASCAAHITLSPVGPPGLSQAEHRFARFGSIVSHVARAPGASFEDCLPALEEALP